MTALRTLLILFCLLPAVARAATIDATERGAVVDTDHYKVTIRDAVVVSIFNKFTREEYLRHDSRLEQILPYLPSGLGTQHGDVAFKAAGVLHRWPWNELPADLSLPNQHYATRESKFAFTKQGAAAATLAYAGLSDGKTSYADEKYELLVEVDGTTGDLLLTAAAHSPRPGVYAANVTIAPTTSVVSIEAPIFDGVRLTSDMQTGTWVNKWPDYWDYQFLAMSGDHTGAVGIWSQDAEWRYKYLYYRPQDRGISVSLSTMEMPPFDPLNSAKGVTWRIQAFDKSWAQAAARFRDWRTKSGEHIAPRPAWTQQISFVNSGVNGGQMWLDYLSTYLDGKHLERTATFASVIRAAAFDTKHWDNTPYATFKQEMPAWKKSGARLLAYLQPMILWGTPAADDVAAQKVVKLHEKADTRSPFQKELKPQLYSDQHNLGDPEWQKWFLDWVRVYIQEQGADGVYHDQSYPCPIDARGPINGMTSIAGMADYFRNAATQSPDSIHGTEHMQEANGVGTSLGIGSGVLWGTALVMRRQRIAHGSPVSNALHYPNGAIWAFPHFSDLGMRDDVTMFHWGMDQMERRGDLAGLALQNPIYGGKSVPFSEWVNELKLDRRRSLIFVDHGLRPTFPEDWDRNVRTYFKGAAGEDFRYLDTPWGSQFVEVVKGQEKLLYGRAHGATYATTPAGIAGWVFYNERGPAGLDPDRYYALDPDIKRPDVYFSPAFAGLPDAPVNPTFYESYAEDGCANDTFALLRVRPLASIGRITGYDKVLLHCPAPPKAVLVNGKPEVAQAQPGGGYLINFQTPADICVILKEPAPGIEATRQGTLARWVTGTNLDLFRSAWITSKLVAAKAKPPGSTVEGPALSLPVKKPLMVIKATQLLLPVRAAAEKPATLRLHVTPNGPLQEFAVDGVTGPSRVGPFEVPFKAGETKLLSLVGTDGMTVAFEWLDAEAKK